MTYTYEIRNFNQTGKCFSLHTFGNEKDARKKYEKLCSTMRELHDVCKGHASALSVLPHEIQLVAYNENCTWLEEIKIEKM